MGTKIKVIGQNQIGGCVVLISTGQSKICIDFGENLPGQQGKAKRAKINWNEEMVDAVFLLIIMGTIWAGLWRFLPIFLSIWAKPQDRCG